MDVLSDVLRMIRLEGALFLNGEFHDPWCVDVPRARDLAQVLLPGAEHLVICHFVVEGSCWIQLRGGEARQLQAGDVVVLPHGDAHLIGSGLKCASVNFDHLVQVHLPEMRRVRYGGDGDRCVLVCGWFSYERGMSNPLVSTLPHLFSTLVGARPSGPWVEQSVRYALAEGALGQPGSNVVASKAAEVLFVEALRGHIESLPVAQRGWLSGLRDPQVGRCLALLHGDPARSWTVSDLAREVNVSRSVLAERFTELMDMAPMQYLKRWRLLLAARLLSNGNSALARIAETIGYESQAAFSRAFKSEFGMSPGVWRHAMASKPPGPIPDSTDV
jgi:AraC-like DNA-binding protein